jgi:putative endonuclease
LSKDFLMHFVYILQCRDDSYYVGLTQNVAERVKVHNSGEGPAFTARRLPVRLAFQEAYETMDEAVHREKQLKGWSRAEKEALISGNLKSLSELAACREPRS